MDLPEPVGVDRITWSPETRESTASSWCGQGVMPREATQEKKRS